MLFKQVVGLPEVKQQLVEMVAHNRLSHALLFLGKEGSGALPLALAFANYVSVSGNQTSASNVVDLFGEAVIQPIPQTPDEADAYMEAHAAYNKLKDLAHPDIHYTYPVVPRKSGDKPISTDYITEWRQFIKEQPYSNVFDWLQFIKAENKQGNITALECNEIVRKLSLKSFESEYKILVLWMPEFLGKEGNKLLKLIEEPPDNTLFILVAENEAQILNTIISRTQLVKVPLPEDEAIIQHLRQTTDVVKAMQVTSVCDGNVREANQLLTDSENNWMELIKETMNVWIAGSPVMVSTWVNKLSDLGREKQKNFIKYIIKMLDYTLRMHILGKVNITLPDEEKGFIEKMQRFASLDQIEQMATLLNENIYHIERNANAKLLFHALMIRMRYIIKNKTVILLG